MLVVLWVIEWIRQRIFITRIHSLTHKPTSFSGTRVLAQVLRKAGWFMGQRVDSRNEDSLPIAWFLTKWLKRLHDFPNVDSRTLTKATSDFDRMVQVHRRGIPSWDAPWGWKNPRSMWLLRFLVDRFPQMKFIHMIRDARDMMLSENRYFLRSHGEWLLGPEWWRNPLTAQLELWRLGNNGRWSSANVTLATA